MRLLLIQLLALTASAMALAQQQMPAAFLANRSMAATSASPVIALPLWVLYVGFTGSLLLSLIMLCRCHAARQRQAARHLCRKWWE